MADVLVLDNVDAGYGEVQVLRGMSLTLRRREVLCMLGLNGAGKRYSPAALRQASLSALGRVGLRDHADAVAGNLAYGHQRLLEVAMGLALEPRLLVLDEPTQGLSATEIESFIALVREIGEQATVLLIEHNMPVVMALAEQITVMDQGRIIAEGTPDAIRANAAVQQAYLGAPADG